MLLPKGQIVYENLNTSFTQLDALLNELHNDHFTGYVQVLSWEYEGLLLMDTGNLVNALELSAAPPRSGSQAAEGIAAKARDKGSTISVYRLSNDLVQLLGSWLKAEPVYKDLSSDFTSLDKLIARLEQEKHTGHIDIRMTKGPDAATIFLQDGLTIESLFSHNGSLTSGSKALSQITQAAGEGAFFTVYRADLEKAYRSITLSDSLERQSTLALWQELFQSVESTADKIKGSGAFLTALKRASLEHAHAFPFLDPFAGEFEYRQGLIQFHGPITLQQFNQGLCLTLAHALRTLTEEGNPVDLLQLKRSLAAIKTQFAARLQAHGLESALPDALVS